MCKTDYINIDYRYGFNGQEKVDEISGAGNHNTALFWEYDTRLGRRWNLDPVVKPWESLYMCFGNNPITQIDPKGDDYFRYQGKGEKQASWHLHKGKKEIDYIGSDGKKHHSKNGSEYMMIVKLGAPVTKVTSENIEGRNVRVISTTTPATIALFKEDKLVESVTTAFSGGVARSPAIDKIDYSMNLGIRYVTKDAKLVDNGADGMQPQKTFGIETFPAGTANNDAVRQAYGNTRIRLIPFGGVARGLYLHGKLDANAPGTHGCLCDRSEKIQNYFLNGAGSNFRGTVGVTVR